MNEVGTLQGDAAMAGPGEFVPALRSRLNSGPDVIELLGAELERVWDQASSGGLFQHPVWCRAWWATFGSRDASPCVWHGLDAGGGVAAYFVWSLWSRPAFGRRYRRVQPLGSSVWTQDAFPSEHPSVVAIGNPAARVGAARQALDALLELEWDDIVIPYVSVGGELDRVLADWAEANALVHTKTVQGRCYSIGTAGELEEYRAGLSANARRAAFGRRRAATAQRIHYVPDDGRPDLRLRTLFELHEARWRGAGMPARGRAFLAELVRHRAHGLAFEITLLTQDGRPVSANYLARAKRSVYSLQGGFTPAEGASIPLGKIHLGYELDAAFGDAGTDVFDLLAGPGMRDDYKAAFATHSAPVYSFRAGRSAWGRAAMNVRRLLGKRLT